MTRLIAVIHAPAWNAQMPGRILNDPELREDFLGFIRSPDRESFLALRARIISSPAYQPCSDELATAGDFCEQQRFDEARDALMGSLPNLLLSPRAHLLLGMVHRLGENRQAAEMEQMIATACVEGIISTGDGSSQEPYIVLRTSDEYDVISYVGKEPESQSLCHTDDRHLDRIECTDGSEYWFDITDAYDQLATTFDPG